MLKHSLALCVIIGSLSTAWGKLASPVLEQDDGMINLRVDGRRIVPMMGILEDVSMPHLRPDVQGAIRIFSLDCWKLYSRQQFQPPYVISARMNLIQPVEDGAGVLLRLKAQHGEVLVGLNGIGSKTCRLRISGGKREYYPTAIPYNRYVTVRADVRADRIILDCEGYHVENELRNKILAGPLGISVFKAHGGWEDVEVKDLSGKTLWRENWNHESGERWSETKTLQMLKAFYGAGVQIFQVGLSRDACGWLSEEDIFRIFDNQCQEVLRHAPDSFIMARTSLDCARLGNKKNQVTLLNAEGKPAGTCPWTFSDMEVLKDQQEFLRHVIAHVQKQSYGRRFLGFLLMSGNGGEWVYHFTQNKFADYSQGHREAYHRFLKERYQRDITGLNRRWLTGHARFEDIDLPSPQRRQWHPGQSVYLDEAKDAELMDFMEFHSMNIAGRINALAGTIQKASHGQLLSGVYYGYSLNAAASLFNKGHNALGVVLDGSISFLASPYQYINRKAGNGMDFQLPVRSADIHGKPYFLEDDTRTVFCTNPSGIQHESTLEDSRGTMRRNMLCAFQRGGGIWYLDWGQGWFSGPLAAEIKHFTTLYKMGMSQQLNRRKPQVAVVIDEHRLNRMRHQREGVYVTVFEQVMVELARCGVPYDVLLLDDLAHARDYSCYLHLNEPNVPEKSNHIALSAGQKMTSRQLREIFSKTGVHVYCHQDHVIYAGRNWVGVHATSNDTVELRLPVKTMAIKEFFSGKKLTVSNGTAKTAMRKGSTELWFWEP